MQTTGSANINVHRLVQPSPDVIVLEPGTKLRGWALMSLAFLPVSVAICLVFRPDLGIAIAICLAPLFAAGGFGAGHIGYQRLGTRVRFNRTEQSVRITGFRHARGTTLPLKQIVAVQFCDAGIKHGDGSWHAYQVNLVVESGGISRQNLLDCGNDQELRKIARQLADFLGVPYFVHDHPA
jgi:hypothetical protein